MITLKAKNKSIAFFCCSLLFCVSALAGDKKRQEENLPYVANGYSVEIWSKKNRETPSVKSKTVEFKDHVRLYAVIKYKGKRYINNFDAVKKGLALPIKDLGKKVSFTWYKVETTWPFYVTKSAYEHEADKFGKFRGIVDYLFYKVKLNEMGYQSSSFSIDASSTGISQGSTGVDYFFRSRSLKWKDRAVGTMRYKLVVDIEGTKITSTDERDLVSSSFTKKNRVHRISVKADTGNQILDWGFAFGNLPYYYGSPSYRWQWYGADCAKLVSAIYKNSVKPNMKYMSTYKLVKLPARAILNGKDKDGVFTDDGVRVRYGKHVRVGDVIVMSPVPNHHTGIIGKDMNANGYLDESDMILHTSWAPVKYEPIKNTPLAVPHENMRIVRPR